MRRSAASTLTTLAEAVIWARDYWDEPPTRLHEHAVQPGDCLGAPRLTGAFMRLLALVDRPGLAAEKREERTCTHPGIGQFEPAHLCAICNGAGTYTAFTYRHLSPMRAALNRLKAADRERNTDFYGAVMALSRAQWYVPAVTPTYPEPYLLMALRRLESRYSSMPIGKPRVSDRARNLSESQAIAEAVPA